MSGFGDPDKLRAARELAQSLSGTKDPRKKKKTVGGSNLGPRQEYREYQPRLPAQQSGHATPSRQAPTYSNNSVPPPSQRSYASSSSLPSAVPLPSQRSYSSSSSFSTGRTSKSVIGSSGLDFLKASGAKPRGNDVMSDSFW